MKINVKIKLTRGAECPIYATDGSAAADLRAMIDEPYTLMPGERQGFPSGVAISPESSGFVAIIAGRSGLGAKHGITLSNGIGVVDSDYRGEIVVWLINNSDEPYTVEPGERVGQMMFVPVFAANFIPCEDLDETGRGTGGFGSTGRN